MAKLTQEVLLEDVENYLQHGRDYKEAAKFCRNVKTGALGIDSTSLYKRLHMALEQGLVSEEDLTTPDNEVRGVSGQRDDIQPLVSAVPPKGQVRSYIITSAQNNTKVHEQALANLIALADYLDCEVLVSRFTYNKAQFGKKSAKPGTLQASDTEDLWYDEVLDWHDRIVTCDGRIELAPGLHFCGEMNLIPTLVNPLSGLHNYTGRNSSIFPHTKFAMRCVATNSPGRAKFMYTTGTVTERNYVQRKEGQKASFHHCYGALLVEVDHTGNWWVRQLNMSRKDGTIYDMDLVVQDGLVECRPGETVEAINWGDLHVATLDPGVRQLAWGAEGMLDTLKPKYQFAHDVLDFRAKNLHCSKRQEWDERFRSYAMGYKHVDKEIEQAASFLADEASRPWCQTVVVNSNHDEMLREWIRKTDYRLDPSNAIFYLECATYLYKTIEADPWDAKPALFTWAANRVRPDLEDRGVKFLGVDESFIICRNSSGGVECGLHGHAGPNGARGSASNNATMGRKINRGHDHSASIVDGVYTAGLSGRFNQHYNKGPSSWSHSHIVTYVNGKRAMVTMWDGKWRAKRD